MAKPLFLAAPAANGADLGAIDKLLVSLEVASGGAVRPSAFFVPHLAIGDVGVEVDAPTWFTKALSALQEAKAVVAMVDGAKTDDGVAFLMGYAFAAGKPIVAWRTDRRQVPHPLVGSAPHLVVGDVKALAGALAPLLA